jgi:hypothetical protein
VSAVAVAGLVVQLVDPGRLDEISLVLLVLATLPWLAPFLDSFEFPGGLRVTMRQVVRRQEDQERLLTAMIFLVTHFVSSYELDHLRKLRSGGPFPYQRTTAFTAELRRLIGVGLIERQEERTLGGMAEQGDLRDHLRITDDGRRFLDLYDDLRHAAR